MCSADVVCLYSLIGLLFCWCDSFYLKVMLVEILIVGLQSVPGEGMGYWLSLWYVYNVCPYFFCIYSSYVFGKIPFSCKAYKIWAFRLHGGSTVLGIISMILHSVNDFFIMNVGGHWLHFALHSGQMYRNTIGLATNVEFIVKTVMSQRVERFIVLIVNFIQFFHETGNGHISYWQQFAKNEARFYLFYGSQFEFRHYLEKNGLDWFINESNLYPLKGDR